MTRAPRYDGENISPARALQTETPVESLEARSLRYDGDLSKKYILDKDPLAVGGQGILRRGIRVSDGKPVVIKKFGDMATAKNWDQYLKGEEGAAREFAFLELAYRHNIRGVQRLVEYGRWGEWEEPTAIVEPIEGEILRRVVLAPGYVPSLEQVLKMTGDLSEPLEFAHSQKPKQFVNRDIHPDNIIVDKNGDYIIPDWGASIPTSGKTESRTSIRTWGYTAPELWDPKLAQKGFDQRTDVYGVGRVATFALTGQRFIDAVNNGDETNGNLLSSLDLPKEVVQALQKATAYNPNDRQNSIGEFRYSLKAAVRERPLAVTSPNEGGNNLDDKVSKGGIEVALGAIGLVEAVAMGSLGAVGVTGLGIGVAGAITSGAVGVVGAMAPGAIVGLEAARKYRLNKKEQKESVVRGGIATGLGALTGAAATAYFNFSVNEAAVFGAYMGGVSVLIEPARIMGKHYLSRWRQLREERTLEAREEKPGMLRRAYEFLRDYGVTLNWESESTAFRPRFEKIHK